MAAPRLARTALLKGITVTADPCAYATAQELQAALGAVIGSAFPIVKRKKTPLRGPGGITVGSVTTTLTLSNPEVLSVNCPGARLEMRCKARVKTKAASISGKVRFSCRLAVRLSIIPGATPSVSASACLSKIKIQRLDLRNVPNWIDDTLIKGLLNSSLQNRVCIDMTAFVFKD